MGQINKINKNKISSRCSRVYWSTLDARKRCVYTCRILVCHPTLLESDLKNVMSPEENRTIAHSPPPMTGTVYNVYISAVLPFLLSCFGWLCVRKIRIVSISLLYLDFPDPFESPRRSDSLSPNNTPKLRVYTRNRHPSYPPCQHSLGPSPIPSLGTHLFSNLL